MAPTLPPPLTSPREVAPHTARDAAQKLSLSILNEWKRHLCVAGNTLCFDRDPYALATEADDADELPTTRVVWLTCPCPTQKQLLRVTEALALLQLVRELDPARWLKTLETLWPDDVRAIGPTDLEEILTTPAMVGLAVTIETTEHMAWVSERVVGSERLSLPCIWDFEALQLPLGACANQAAAPRIPVALKINDIKSLGQRDRLYAQLFQLVLTQHRLMKLTRLEPRDPSTSFQGKQERSCFHVVKMDLDGPALKHLYDQEIDNVGRIAAHGVRLTMLRDMHLRHELQPETTLALHALIPPERQSHRQYFGFEQVELSDWSSPSMIAPVLSSLQVSQSVRKVFLTMKEHADYITGVQSAHRRSLWQWIAYGLFSRHACHNIQEVELDMSLLAETDVTDFQGAALSQNPLEALGYSEPSQPNQFIGATRFFVERGLELLELRTDTLIVVRVIAIQKGEQGDYLRVVLPGCGVVLVHEVDLTDLPRGYVHYEEASPSIKHLKLTNGSAESMEIGYAFLRAVPCHVESVEFADEHEYTAHGEE